MMPDAAHTNRSLFPTDDDNNTNNDDGDIAVGAGGTTEVDYEEEFEPDQTAQSNELNNSYLDDDFEN